MEQLSNKLLIATPSIEQDTIFHRSLIYTHLHDQNHALGFIVNKASDLTIRELLKQHSKLITKDLDQINSAFLDQRLYVGGPVDPGNIFCLYEANDIEDEGDEIIGGTDLCVSQGVHMIRRHARGKKPKRCLYIHGHSEWGSGQLEKEIVDDSWIIADTYSVDVLFNKHIRDKAFLAAKHIGIDLNMMVRSLR